MPEFRRHILKGEKMITASDRKKYYQTLISKNPGS